MRNLSADYVYTPDGQFLPKAIVQIDDKGKILKLVNTYGNLQETSSLEYYNGILIPGFVNTHCHLELSHMKGMIKPKQKLHGFVEEIIAKRFTPENLQDILEQADLEMRSEGIVAVGDISNTADSFLVKKKSPIYYHTFIELFTSADNQISGLISNAKAIRNKLGQLAGNFVPHASYTVSDRLYNAISQLNEENMPISVHNQETASEDELFEAQSGALYDTLRKIGFDYSGFAFDGNNSLQRNFSNLPKTGNKLFIHNTYTKADDIDYAENLSKSNFWVLCPASNLYIENRLPDIPVFFEKGLQVCIGTDSYASNNKLSILYELKIIHKHFPEIALSDLIDAACINGARALNIEERYGSLAPGKYPGVNLLTGIDYRSMTLSHETDVKPLV